MKLKFIIAAIFTCLSISVTAQEVSSVYSAGGNCEISLGETFVSTVSNDECEFTHGFLQGLISIKPSSIKAIDSDNLFKVLLFPNPVISTLFISVSDSYERDYRIQIFDTNGMLIANYNLKQNNSTLDLSSFKSGVYIIKIISTDNTSVLYQNKIIKI